jgi:hypothetical protein
MKLKNAIFLFAITVFVCYGCQNQSTPTSLKTYPYIDTIKVGMQADSGDVRYASYELYFKHYAKDTMLICGASRVQIGTQTWHIATIQMPLDFQIPNLVKKGVIK